MGFRAKLRLGIAAFFLLLALVVGIQNSGPILLRFLFWNAEVDGLLLYLILLLLGAGAGAGLTLFLRDRRS